MAIYGNILTGLPVVGCLQRKKAATLAALLMKIMCQIKGRIICTDNRILDGCARNSEPCHEIFIGCFTCIQIDPRLLCRILSIVFVSLPVITVRRSPYRISGFFGSRFCIAESPSRNSLRNNDIRRGRFHSRSYRNGRRIRRLHHLLR